MIVLDSSVWVAYFKVDDTHHQRAWVLMEEINGLVGVPEYVIVEVCTVLHMKAGKEVVRQFLEILVDNVDVEILLSSSEFLFKVMRQYQIGVEDKLSFVDTALAVLSETHQIITFDRKLESFIRAMKG